MFQSPGEVAFKIFDFPVFWYGIILASAAFIGFYTAQFLYRLFYKDSYTADKIIDIAPFLIIAGILGARLYYCLVNYSYYSEHVIQIFDFRQGGLSIHGMILGGILGLIACTRYYKLDILKLLDAFSCATALAQAIGRWGNFFNSEAFGMPTDLPWKLFIPIDKRPFSMVDCDFFHPTFLYESLLDLLIFFILLSLYKKFLDKSGMIFVLYLLLYSFVRIGIEYLRVDSVLNIFGFPVAQWASVLVIIFAVFFAAYIYTRKKS